MDENVVSDMHVMASVKEVTHFQIMLNTVSHTVVKVASPAEASVLKDNNVRVGARLIRAISTKGNCEAKVKAVTK
ncbi:hypothetical protein V6N12_042622 [Hibiscus sabdariffa]